MERVGGIKYTIKDGIVYDAKKLLEDVAAMVEKQKKQRDTTVRVEWFRGFRVAEFGFR